jgi:phosphoglycolate phosphatase
MLLAALAETGVSARDAVMVGDTSFDIQMARAAGIRAIGVDWGYHSRDKLAGAAEIISDFRALPEVLEKLWMQVT